MAVLLSNAALTSCPEGGAFPEAVAVKLFVGINVPFDSLHDAYKAFDAVTVKVSAG